MSRRAELAARRDALVARSAELREQLAADGAGLRVALGRWDRLIGKVRSVATRPVLLAAAAGLVFILKPARLLRWAGRGMVLVSMYRKFSGLLAMAAASRRSQSSREPPRVGHNPYGY